MVCDRAAADRTLVLTILSALADLDVSWAVLHKEGDLAKGEATSDIDVITDRPPTAVHAALVPLLRDKALHPVALWEHEIGGAALFVVSPDLKARVMVDLVHDPHGRATYGVRTNVMLEKATIGHRWPRTSELDELLYLASKRAVKRDPERFAEIAARVREMGLAQARARALEIFSDRRRAEVLLAAIASEGGSGAVPDVKQRLAFHLRTAHRRARRIRRPTGFWVHLESQGAAAGKRLYRALSHVLPRVVFIELPAGGVARRQEMWLRRVASMRWRTGLVVSTGSLPAIGRPDMVLGDGEAGPQRVINAMVCRTARRLGVGQDVSPESS